MTARDAADRPPISGPSRTSRDNPVAHSPDHPGADAHAAGHTLTSTRVAALPLIDRFLRRLRLDESLRGRLPREDRRARVGTTTALLLLLRNLLVSREPLYGVGEWAARHDPVRLGLTPEQ